MGDQTLTTDTANLVTGDEFWRMGDLGPSELVDGRIVAMSPTGGVHGLVESVLSQFLGAFVRQHRLGYVLVGEVGIYTARDPDRVRGVDLAFWTNTQLPDGPPPGFVNEPPYLAVEILSPGDQPQQIQTKVDEYLSVGVEHVWIVEPERRLVRLQAVNRGTVVLDAADTLHGSGALTGFSLSLDELFADL